MNSLRPQDHYIALTSGFVITGVELDATILDMGRKHFGLGKLDVETVNADARQYLYSTDERFNAIVIDTYNFPYLPDHLSTSEFFALVRSRLEEGGVAVLNVGHHDRHRSILDVMQRTCLSVFERAYAYEMPSGMNTLLFLMDHPLEEAHDDLEQVDVRLRVMARHVRKRLKNVALTKGPVSTDDRPLAHWLTNKIVLQAFGVLR